MTVAELPDAALESLARGLGAYLRATPRPELPGPLRRWHGFRQHALTRHRREIVGALEDDEVRARVLEWLDAPGRRSPPPGAETLRLAAARADGWMDELGAGSAPRADQPGPPGPPKPTEEERLRERLGKEQEKLRRARDETRSAREAARTRLAAERARAAKLATRLKAAEAELRRAEHEAQSARREKEKLSEEAQRKVRRAQRELEAARAERSAQRTEARAERRRAASLGRRVETLEADLARARRPPKPLPAAIQERPRKVLRPPMGRLPDAPATLDEWLATPRVHLLVDGYNVTHAPEGFPELGIAQQRERLIEALQSLARRRPSAITVVFDGSELAPGTKRRVRGPVQVHYSRPQETADDHLVALLPELPPDPVVVATNDRELQERVAELGATIASSDQLLSLIR